jgi:NitT/TauT family transport system permease protein
VAIDLTEMTVSAASVPSPMPGSPTRKTARRRLAGAGVTSALPPAGLAALVLAGWTLVSDHILATDKRFLLPSPLQVLRLGVLDGTSRSEILHALGATTKVAVTGLVISMVAGVFLAVLMSQSRWVERAVYPYAVVLQTVPIIAVVPLIGYSLGFNFRSRVLVCVLISIFPIITNTLFGLKSVDAGLHDLFSLHAVSRLTRLRKLQLPAALPAMFEGFRISAGLGVIGAVVADFFFRQGDIGIGRLIDMYRQQLATEQLITSVLASSLLGVVVFWAFSLIAARVTGDRG